jgi:hypothetical protein
VVLNGLTVCFHNVLSDKLLAASDEALVAAKSGFPHPLTDAELFNHSAATESREMAVESKHGGAARVGLLGAFNAARRKEQLENRLRNEAEALLPFGRLHGRTPEELELHEAIREVAIPALDQKKSDEEAKKSAPAHWPPIVLPPGVLSPMPAVRPIALPRGILGSAPVKRKPVRQNKAQLNRQRVIFGAIQAGLKGLKYCHELDRKRLSVREIWIEEGCPRSYAEAYRAGEPWKKKIQDEKSRHHSTYDELTDKEREKIIQGSTRSTRS